MNEIIIVSSLVGYLVLKGFLGEGGKEIYHGSKAIYDKMRERIRQRVDQPALEQLEAAPESEAPQQALIERLAKADPGDRQDLIGLAAELAQAVDAALEEALDEAKARSSADGPTAIDIERLKVKQDMILKNLHAHQGTAFRLRDGEVDGNFVVDGSTAGTAGLGK